MMSGASQCMYAVLESIILYSKLKHCYHFYYSALIVPTGFLIAAGFIPCDKKYLGIVFMTTAVGFTGFANSGFTANIHDIASK